MSVPLSVLYEDNHLLALAKPAGLPTVPDDSGDESLLSLAKAWVKRQKGKRGEAYLGVVHRLDRPVSGVVVFARTSKAAARLTQVFKNRDVEKLYWGVSARAPAAESGCLEHWLQKDERRNVVSVVPRERPGAWLACTHWRVLARTQAGGEPRVWLEFRPETGRPHQLRVAARALGCPLLGDLKYGAARPLSDRSIALHARALEFPHPTRGERLRVQCAPPELDVWRFESRPASE